jgi:tetratricopeptide (TPR) repeat protein
MVQSYGVAFQADDSIFLRLRKAGASEALLETIRKQAKSRELRIEVIKSEPPPPEPEAVPAPAREHLQLGQQKLKSYDYEGALREFAEAERILPQWDQIFQQRGLAFEALGRYSDAASEWKLYLSLAPANVNKAGVEQQIAKWEGEASRVNNTRLLLNQGNQQLQRGDTKGAAQSFRAAVALGNSVGTLLALARAQLLDGDYAGVEETARQAQMFDPQSALAARYLADAKVRQAKSGSPVVDRGVKSDPGSREARNNLGQAPSGQADAAVAEFRDLIKLNPNSADAHYNLANALASKGDLDSAIASYRESLRLRPESVQAHNNLANALRSQRKFDEALSEYREAIRLSPPQAYLHFNLANALADAGKFKEAIEQYGFALKLDPDDPETHNNLAVAQAAAGNLDKAADEYRQALRLSPGFARAHYNLGLLLERQGNRSAAVSEFSEAIRAQPDYAAAHFSLGQALERTGKLQDALAHLRTSWELNPQNVNSLSEYERLLKAAKQSAGPPAPVN